MCELILFSARSHPLRVASLFARGFNYHGGRASPATQIRVEISAAPTNSQRVLRYASEQGPLAGADFPKFEILDESRAIKRSVSSGHLDTAIC